MRATFNGDPVRPAIALRFSFSAAHPRTAEPLRAWVKEIPENEWTDEHGVWIIRALGAQPDRFLADAGFHVQGPDGSLITLRDYVAPLAMPDSEHPGFTAVYPRLLGHDKAEHLLPLGSTWRQKEHRWLVPTADLVTDGHIPDGITAHYTFDLGNSAAGPGTGQQPTVVATEDLVYDYTVDGLRGVPVTDLLAVNEITAESMQAFGIGNVFDLLHHIPRRYIDRSNPELISGAKVGDKIAIFGEVTGVTSKNGLAMVFVVDPAGTRVTCKWFNAGWIARKFRKGDQVILYGKLDTWEGRNGTQYSIGNPLMDVVGDDSEAMLPVYPQSARAEINTWQLHRAAKEAAGRLGQLLDPIPQNLIAKRGLISRHDAYISVHTPETPEKAISGRDRLSYDELLRFQLAMRVQSAVGTSPQGIRHTPTGKVESQMISSLPFPLTGAQSRSLDEIEADLRSPKPMNRLLQGDVGSGKTLVVLAAMLKVVENGFQGALMAPTEILASQHYFELCERLAGVVDEHGRQLHAVLLTNKVTGAARKAALAEIVSGAAHIVVGTHALLPASVKFHRLGLAVVDEQHRFGVEQRAALSAKGPEGMTPDLLFATATPIPRTAVMTVFGDLDVSILDEKPPGRTSIVTEWVRSNDARVTDPGADPWAKIREEVAAGRQAFVVCPMVSDSETKAAASAEGLARELAVGALDGLSIAIVHGKQKPEERSEIMAKFAAGGTDVLVATTVIEVGVNVPNATVIAIVGADRFGIAQLHQLRGRVGRGRYAGFCYLVAEAKNADAEERMKALVDTDDGFKLSEIDLQIRGWGTLLGSAQAGAATDLRVADLFRDETLVGWAREDAMELLANDERLARRPGLRDEISRAVGAEAQQWLVSH